MTQLTRRTMVKGMAAAGVVAAFPAIAACGVSNDDASSEVGTVTLGSNQSDPIPKKAFAELFGQFERESGGTVKINTVDSNTFQEQINSYLQGRPDDVFTWFAGYRMQFFAQRGLAHDISDVWQDIGSNFSEGTKQAATGLDGKQYLVPFVAYPCAMFYRKSVFDTNGYEIPKTLDELVALTKQMQSDGIVPIAFGDKDGWPAMGTFDILNLRINGYDFHMRSPRSTRTSARTRWMRRSTASCSRRTQRTSTAPKEMLKYVATGKAQNLYLKSDPNFISLAKDADTSAYTPLQQKAAELVANAKNFSQFLGRDTRPDFASTVMIPRCSPRCSATAASGRSWLTATEICHGRAPMTRARRATYAASPQSRCALNHWHYRASGCPAASQRLPGGAGRAVEPRRNLAHDRHLEGVGDGAAGGGGDHDHRIGLVGTRFTVPPFPRDRETGWQDSCRWPPSAVRRAAVPASRASPTGHRCGGSQSTSRPRRSAWATAAARSSCADV